MEELFKSLIGLGPVGIVLALSVMANIAQWRRNNQQTDQRLDDFKKFAENKAVSDQKQFEVMSTLQSSVNSLIELVKMGR